MKLERLPGDAYRRNAQDGAAHFAYYDRHRSLSFVWDGVPAHPIEVESGGYGEPVVALLSIDEGDLSAPRPESPHEWLDWFELVCDAATSLLLRD